MEWKSDYEIGITTIDEQHKKLFDLLQFVRLSLKDGLITRDTGIAIKELVEYTKYHFSSEECIMEKCGYPQLDEHKERHRHLICEIRQLLLELKRGKEITSLDLLNLLTKWIVNHILDEDLKLKTLAAKAA